MSFTFSTGTNIGKVRALVGDTDQTLAKLSDEEIGCYLELTVNDIYASAAMAARAMATKAAAQAKSISAGNYSENTTAGVNALLDLAKQFDLKSSEIPAEAQAEQIFNDFSFREVEIGKALRGETE